MSDLNMAGLFAGTELALCPVQAQNLLAMPMPDFASDTVSNTAMVARGERFAISRGVAVVPIKGILTPNMFALERWLGWATYHGLEETFEELAAHEDVAAVVLEFDTPGGMVLGVQAAAAAIAFCAKSKPLHALVHPLCASAGYWLASQATDIAATPGSLIGSIGTMRSGYSAVGPGMNGQQLFEMRSSHAQAKNPDPATESGKAEIQRTLDVSEAEFHAAISAGRGIALADLPERLSVTQDEKDGGRAFEVAEAQTRGLIDAAENRNVFYARIFAKYSPKPRGARRALSTAAKAKAALAQASI